MISNYTLKKLEIAARLHKYFTRHRFACARTLRERNSRHGALVAARTAARRNLACSDKQVTSRGYIYRAAVRVRGVDDRAYLAPLARAASAAVLNRRTY